MTRITRYAPRLAGWPAGLSLRIVALSDFHTSRPWLDAARLRSICAEANALQPDLTVLLGDYGAGPRFGRNLHPAEWAAELATLVAPLGVHAVLGNHDYDDYERADLAAGRLTPAEAALQAVGIAVYVNRVQRIVSPNGAFWLAGLGDQFAFTASRHSRDYSRGQGVDDLPATLAQVQGDEPVILMAHEPDIFPDLPDRVAPTLSGHTHAGQVRLFGRTPVVPSRYGSRYVHGHFVEGPRQLIVSAGLGYSGWPIRLGTWPEIVQIDLGAAA